MKASAVLASQMKVLVALVTLLMLKVMVAQALAPKVMAERVLPTMGTAEQALHLLVEPEEYALLKAMAEYPQLVAGAATDLAPHRVIFYLMELAGQFHSFYNKHKVLGTDLELSQSRLYLCGALKRVFRNGLHLIGLSAPESM